MTMSAEKLCPLCDRPMSRHPFADCFMRPDSPRGSMLGLATASGVAIGTERPAEPLQDGGEREAMDAAWKSAIEAARERGFGGDLIPRYFFFEAGWNARHPHQDVEPPTHFEWPAQLPDEPTQVAPEESEANKSGQELGSPDEGGERRG